MKVYPAESKPAAVCHNCYRLFEEFCVRRDTIPTDASIWKFGCDAFFDPEFPEGEHNCHNCKSFRKQYCTYQKKVVNDPETQGCMGFLCRPYMKVK